MSRMGCIALLLALGCAPAVSAAPTPVAAQDPAPPSRRDAPEGQLPPDLTAAERTVVNVAREVSPAVVRIRQRRGEGSGVIIREDGIILTNAHVVGAAAVVEVGLPDGRRLPGEVLGRDPSIDIAVIRMDEAGLPTARLGDSDRLVVGQAAIAIGNPFGLGRTLTTGVISAINRSPQGFELEGLLQTDAAINPGNSGGPLLDSHGRVIGINTAVLRPRGVGAEGLGFAVPINLARDVVQQLLTTGRIVRAYVGVHYGDVTPQLARQFRLPADEGIVILAVEAGSPAARAGLRPQDIVTRVDGEPVAEGSDFRRILRQRRPGERLTLRVLRGGREIDLQVELGAARVD